VFFFGEERKKAEIGGVDQVKTEQFPGDIQTEDEGLEPKHVRKQKEAVGSIQTKGKNNTGHVREIRN